MTPQLENGYTKIANEIFSNLAKIRIPGESGQILNVIFRKTYGFNKKRDRIALSQFCGETGLKKPNVCRAIKKLICMKIIIKIDTDLGEIYEFQKDARQWIPLSKKITHGKAKSLSKKIIGVIQKDNASLSKKIHTKETNTKETNTKEIGEASSPPFSLKDEIKKLEDSPRRDLNIIALYLEHRKPDLKNKEQFEITLKRHLRAAKNLKVFTDNQILKALDKAKRDYPEYTLETLIKLLTK